MLLSESDRLQAKEVWRDTMASCLSVLGSIGNNYWTTFYSSLHLQVELKCCYFHSAKCEGDGDREKGFWCDFMSNRSEFEEQLWPGAGMTYLRCAVLVFFWLCMHANGDNPDLICNYWFAFDHVLVPIDSYVLWVSLVCSILFRVDGQGLPILVFQLAEFHRQPSPYSERCCTASFSLDCISGFWRFLLQLVGILLEDIVTKQLKVDMNEQQHTFYCQELGTLLMCLIHIFKSGNALNIALCCSMQWQFWDSCRLQWATEKK